LPIVVLCVATSPIAVAGDAESGGDRWQGGSERLRADGQPDQRVVEPRALIARIVEFVARRLHLGARRC